MSTQTSSELTKRVLTALFGVSLLLVLLFWGGYWGVCLFTFVISMGMLLEFTTMAFQMDDAIQKRWTVVSLGVIFYFRFVLFHAEPMELITQTFLGLFVVFLILARTKRDQVHLNLHTKECVYSFFGFFYCVLLPSYFVQIRPLENGVAWIAFFFLVVWAGDSGAFFVGRKWGRTLLYPVVSPKKSVEGLLGGLTASALVGVGFGYFALSQYSLASLLFASVLISAVSAVGDLCESLIKRGFAVKDSGSILPGHGGFLDRFDGVVFSLPIMYAWLKWLP